MEDKIEIKSTLKIKQVGITKPARTWVHNCMRNLVNKGTCFNLSDSFQETSSHHVCRIMLLNSNQLSKMSNKVPKLFSLRLTYHQLWVYSLNFEKMAITHVIYTWVLHINL